MENTTMKEAAMNAVRGICMRLWRGANTGHAGTFRSVQGTTVPFAGFRGRGYQLTDLRIAVASTADSNSVHTVDSGVLRKAQ